MGLSFSYRGKLKRAKMLPTLITEVEDICNILGWKTNTYETEFPSHKFIKPINQLDYGIVFQPPDCDPICLVFDSNGFIYVPWLKELLHKNDKGDVKVITVHLHLTDDGLEPVVTERDNAFDPRTLVYQVHVKTQTAGMDTHIKVVELMKYLSAKYLKNFDLSDESAQDTNGENEEIHDDKMKIMNEFLDTFQELLNKSNINSPKDFLRLLKKMGKKPKRNRDDSIGH